MKKFISMVMAAAMVVSLVPATAFALSGDVTAKAEIIKAADLAETKNAQEIALKDAPELKLTATDVLWKTTDNTDNEITLTLALDGAVWCNEGKETVFENYFPSLVTMKCDELKATATSNVVTGVTVNEDRDEVEFTVAHYDLSGNKCGFHEDDVLYVDLNVIVEDTNTGDQAKITVESDDITIVEGDGLVFAEVVETAVKASIKEETEIAEESEKLIEKKIEIESAIDKFVAGQVIEAKLSAGFEFVSMTAGDLRMVAMDEDEATFEVVNGGKDTLVIGKDTLKIEAVDAKAGDEATLTLRVRDAKWNATTEEADKDTNLWAAKADGIVIAVVLGDEVLVSVDEDEDVPVYYSGVNANNGGITEKDDHISLKVTMEESVEDAWDLKDAFEINIPDGVYVIDVDVTKAEGIAAADNKTATQTVEAAFAAAYDKADFKGFEFSRKALTESDNDDSVKTKIEFEMTLVADPGFVGDVVLETVIDGTSKEVVIANFVAPYFVEAAQNDVIIDYRHTAVSDIVVKEAEAGLWEKGLSVAFAIEKMEISDFENEVKVDVNEESDMDVKEGKYASFTVTTESDDEAAVVTLSDVSLYMNRSIAAGAYDLKATVKDKAGLAYGEDVLFGRTNAKDGTDKYVSDVTDADGVVKEGYINVITAGRDQDDASFTKKVVVPVGEAYIVAGEETVALDVPAYVSAAGYTMLPVRAVAVALGINNNNVLWDQASKTVTILYGQRIITMQVGAKVVYVNGSAIPASASPEVVDGRTFLPMRDLATALGVTDITWDAATKTATLNGNK